MCRKFKLECNCHSGPKLTKYNVGTDIETMFRQRSGNVVWMLYRHWSPTLGTEVVRMFTMLRECCGNVAPNIEDWHSHNVHTIHTMFKQCCLNVVSTLVPNTERDVPQHSHNGAWMLSQCWPTSTNIVTTLWQRWDFVQNTMLVQHSHIETTLAQTLWQCCHNIGALAGYIKDDTNITSIWESSWYKQHTFWKFSCTCASSWVRARTLKYNVDLSIHEL